MVINSRAGYYFATPQGWLLDKASDYQYLKVVHSDSAAVFDVSYDRARGTPTMYYMSMVMTLESPDYHWLSFGEGAVTLGGREAKGFRGTREKDGRKVKELIWLALVDEYVYIVSSTVDLEKFEARAVEIDQMFSTFSWGAPPHAP